MPSYSSIIAADADQNLAVSSTAVTLTLPAAYSATGSAHSGRVTIQVRTAPIIYTINGTAPTAADESTGIKLNVGDILILTTLASMRNLKLIRATAVDGAVFAQYEVRVN